MSRPARLPIGALRPADSFIGPRRGTSSRLTECEPGGRSIARTASRRSGRRPLTGLLGSAILALALAFDCLAESRIGRLFSTVEQRIELDRIRDRPAVEPVAEPVASEPEVETEPRLALDPEPRRNATPLVVTVNGLVIRSDGHHLAWVDGVEAGVEATTSGGADIEVDRAQGGRVRIRLPERGVHVELKPGQTIDVVRGSVFEAYETRPVRRAAETSGAPAPEPGAAASAGVPRPCPLPLRGCGFGSAEDETG